MNKVPVSSIILSIHILFLSGQTIRAAGSYQNEVVFSNSYGSSEATINGYSTNSLDVSVDYVRSFRPIKFQNTPYPENMFLQRIPHLTVTQSIYVFESNRNGNLESDYQSLFGGVDYYHARENSPFTFSVGLGGYISDYQSSSYSDASESVSENYSFGFYFTNRSKIDLSMSRGETTTTTTTDRPGTVDEEKHSSASVSFKHFQPLFGQNSLTIATTYRRFTNTYNNGSDRISIKRDIFVTWYFSNRTGLTTSYEWNSSSSGFEYQDVGLLVSHTGSPRFNFKVGYERRNSDNSFNTRDQEIIAGIGFRF